MLILPMQNNKSVKALYTSDVWKVQYSGWGLMSNTALNFARAVFPTQPHPQYCIFLTSVVMVL